MKSGHQSPAELVAFYGNIKAVELAIRNDIIAPLFKRDQLGKRKYFMVSRQAPAIRGAGEGGRAFNYQRERAARLWTATVQIVNPKPSNTLFALYNNGEKLMRLNKVQHPVLLKTAERIIQDWVPNVTVVQEYIDNETPVMYNFTKRKKEYVNPSSRNKKATPKNGGHDLGYALQMISALPADTQISADSVPPTVHISVAGERHSYTVQQPHQQDALVLMRQMAELAHTRRSSIENWGYIRDILANFVGLSYMAERPRPSSTWVTTLGEIEAPRYYGTSIYTTTTGRNNFVRREE